LCWLRLRVFLLSSESFHFLFLFLRSISMNSCLHFCRRATAVSAATSTLGCTRGSAPTGRASRRRQSKCKGSSRWQRRSSKQCALHSRLNPPLPTRALFARPPAQWFTARCRASALSRVFPHADHHSLTNLQSDWSTVPPSPTNTRHTTRRGVPTNTPAHRAAHHYAV